MEAQREITPRQKLESAIAALGLTVAAEFVPFSQSRNKDSEHRSLNWKVTIQRNGRDILTTDYGAGIAHCPAYKLPVSVAGNQNSIMRAGLIEFETEKGTPAPARGIFSSRKPILPDSVDVIWSLSRDSDVLDAGGFEDWADSLGYDTDSRSAESIYRACLEIALKLRAAIGEDGLEALREAGEDF